jgi:hypothetical protein
LFIFGFFFHFLFFSVVRTIAPTQFQINSKLDFNRS